MPARWRAPPRCAARSRRSAPTGCATASAPTRTPVSCASWPRAGPCSTSARSRTSAPERSRRSPTIRCRGSSPQASAARSRPTTRRCSTPTSPATTRPPPRSGLDPRSFYEAGVAGALCDDGYEGAAATGRRQLQLALEVPLDGGGERSGAGRLAPGGPRGGARPRGPARDLPEHAHHARRRGARAHPVPAGEDPRLVLHRPRERGRVRSASRPRWAPTTSARRSTATWACTSRAASSRGASSRSTWAAPTGRRRAATATCTWPTRTSGSSRWSATCPRCCRSRSARRSHSASARSRASRSAGSAKARPRAATRTRA